MRMHRARATLWRRHNDVLTCSKLNDLYQFYHRWFLLMAAEGLNDDWVEAEISRQLELISIEDEEPGEEESIHQQVPCKAS